MCPARALVPLPCLDAAEHTELPDRGTHVVAVIVPEVHTIDHAKDPADVPRARGSEGVVLDRSALAVLERVDVMLRHVMATPAERETSVIDLHAAGSISCDKPDTTDEADTPADGATTVAATASAGAACHVTAIAETGNDKQTAPTTRPTRRPDTGKPPRATTDSAER